MGAVRRSISDRLAPAWQVRAMCRTRQRPRTAPWFAAMLPITPDRWRSTAWALALAFALPLVAADPPARQHRFLLDHDGHAQFSTLTADYRADIDERVKEIPPNVTTFLLCCGAGRFYFPTKVGLVDPRLKQLNAEHAKGNDPFGR